MPISHELLPSGQSVASIVYVPASTCTIPVKLFHEPAPVVVEPLKRYVPGVGAVTVIPGAAPTVLGSPVTRGYRFANSPPPPLRLVLSGRIHSCAVSPDSEVAVLRGGRGLAGEDFEAHADDAGRDCNGIAARGDLTF